MNPSSFAAVGAAIGRLVAVALSDTGQSAKVADFLLAWWNGDDNGHFPVLHLCNVDRPIADDMLLIMGRLAETSVIYADAWGYRSAMELIWSQRREGGAR